MKKHFTLFSVLVGFCLLDLGAANAQPYIHLSSTPDLSGSPTLQTYTPFLPFDVYVVADGFSEAGLDGIAGAEWSLTFPPDILALSLTLPFGALNIGTPPNVIMGLGATIPAASEPILLATYTLFPTVSGSDTLLTLGPSSPSSVGGAGPAYLSDGLVDTFSFSSDLLLNQSTAPTPDLYPVVPEPTTLTLLALGSLALMRRRCPPVI